MTFDELLTRIKRYPQIAQGETELRQDQDIAGAYWRALGTERERTRVRRATNRKEINVIPPLIAATEALRQRWVRIVRETWTPGKANPMDRLNALARACRDRLVQQGDGDGLAWLAVVDPRQRFATFLGALMEMNQGRRLNMTDKTKERKEVEAEVLAREEMSDSLDNAFVNDCKAVLATWMAERGSPTDFEMLVYLGFSGGWAAGIAYERRRCAMGGG